MTQQSIFEHEGRAVPYIVEGEGPIGLVLIAAAALEADPLGVVAHYLAEEAGFHVVRIGADASSAGREQRAADAVAVMDHLGFADAWIGGYGSGGKIARVLTAAHPDRANGLLLLGVEEDDTSLAPLIPVLIIQGADDASMPPSNGEALQAIAPERTSVKTIAGADHRFPVTHLMDTAVTIEEYLDWD
ncbi:alpha/beta hydrolase [Microbacterium sp.]|uniref:alpha/beta fold hydrolase n=1 Tax=Microbacterium sp. TaxID=51671 RepID=UPI002810FBD7|nr:alpha/beta hydrolase [Microbacterium sp.]